MIVGDRVTVVSAKRCTERIGTSGVIQRFDSDGDAWVTFDSDERTLGFEKYKLKKEVKGMLKSELKTGYLVQLSNGQWATIIKDCGCTEGTKDMYVYIDGSGWDSLEYHDENLKYTGSFPDDFTIQKVATCAYMMEIIAGVPVEKLMGFKVIWQCENHKAVQLKTLCDILRGQLQKAQDELKELRA